MSKEIESISEDLREARRLLSRAFGKTLGMDIGVGQRREERLFGSLLCKLESLERNIGKRKRNAERLRK